MVYEGAKFVKTEGRVQATLTASQMDRLSDEIARAGYASLSDTYGFGNDGYTSKSSDSPTVRTSVWHKKGIKSVDHYLGYYAGSTRFTAEINRLKAFEMAVDAIIRIEQWIGTKEERSKFEYLKRLPPLNDPSNR